MLESKGLGREIERLLQYGLYKQLIDQEDVFVVRNALLSHFELQEASIGFVFNENLPYPTPILENMLNLMSINNSTARELQRAKIMGFLTPRASEVARTFWERYKISPENATDYYYKLSIDTNYVQKENADKDQFWEAETETGKVQITINLSKPEKDPKDIAAARLLPPVGYPRCVLCAENAGYAGRLNHPARQNHRIVPMNLQGKKWYLQFSPYLYYAEHCIILNVDHTPMHIDAENLGCLVEFVTLFPHYFIGSNTDLPIVGGSILSHDHFQGGRHRFPIEDARIAHTFICAEAPHTTIAMLDWPLAVIRLHSKDSKELLAVATAVLNAWKMYSDPTVNIFTYTEKTEAAEGTGKGVGSGAKVEAGGVAGQKTPHNTVTPMARRVGDAFELDLVLRNNLTTAEHPLGLFHPHADVQHIKKENIGLPEATGLAILPPRLKMECLAIGRLLQGESKHAPGTVESLQKHDAWIADMLIRHGTKNSKSESERILEQEIAQKFVRCMEDAGVFKRTAEGRAAFTKFLVEGVGLKQI